MASHATHSPISTLEPTGTVRVKGRFWERHPLSAIGIAVVAAQLAGSAFNIYYNVVHVLPLLSKPQQELLFSAIQWANAIIYPTAMAIGAWLLWTMHDALRKITQGNAISIAELMSARRRAVNLPWSALMIVGTAWLMCIPAILIPLSRASEVINPAVYFHLPISLTIGGMFGATHAFFGADLASARLLYPILFPQGCPTETPGTIPVTLRVRGVIWAVSGVISPVICLWLLIMAPRASGGDNPGFASFVCVLAISFGLAASWLLSRLITDPIHALRTATRRVASGHLDTEIGLRRSDEFGPLIHEFNGMVRELQMKQRLQQAFGRHVGAQAAEKILAQNPDLAGVEQVITVMFVDLRDFTARSESSSPRDVVAILNLFLTEMVHTVEEIHGGMVNKFLGDGFMAIFGAGTDQLEHAHQAVAAGIRMLGQLDQLNATNEKLRAAPLAMGIGIHTGPAIVGNIGSDGRGDYTAIGDTVNLGSRIEGLTKALNSPLLVSAATREAVAGASTLVEFPPQFVKGREQPVVVFGLQMAGCNRRVPSELDG